MTGMYDPADAIHVTKMDVVHRQLRMAIRLWFDEGDPICIHTLAAAAHQIIHDINIARKGPPLLFDSKTIAKGERQKFVQGVKFDQSFFKHGDRGKAGQAKDNLFHPDSNLLFIFASLMGLQNLGEPLDDHCVAFLAWIACYGAEAMSNAGQDALKQNIPSDVINQIRSERSKREVFDILLRAMTKNSMN